MTNKFLNSNVVSNYNGSKCRRSQSVHNYAFPLSIRSYKERRRASATVSDNYTSYLTQSTLVEHKSHFSRTYCAAALVHSKLARCENCQITNITNSTTINQLSHINNNNSTVTNTLLSQLPTDIRAKHASSSSSFKSALSSSEPSTPSSPLPTSAQNTLSEYNACNSKHVTTDDREPHFKNVEANLQRSISCGNPLEETQNETKLRTTSLNIPRHRLTHKESINNSSSNALHVHEVDVEQETEPLLLQSSTSADSSSTETSSAIPVLESQSDELCVNKEQKYIKDNKIVKLNSRICANEMLWLADKSGTVEIHDVNNDEEILLRTIECNEGKSAVKVMHSLCNNQIAIGFANGKIHIYNTETAIRVARLLAHTTSITCLLSTELNLNLFTQYENVNKQERVKESELMQEEENSETEERVPILLSAASDGDIAKWELKSFTCVSRFRADVHAITALAITESKMFALAGNERGVIRMWDLTNDTLIELSKSEKRKLMKCCTLATNNVINMRNVEEEEREENEEEEENEEICKVEVFNQSQEWMMNENQSACNSLNVLRNDASCNAKAENVSYICNDKNNNYTDGKVAKVKVNKRNKKSKRGKNAKQLLQKSNKTDINNIESTNAMLTLSQNTWSYTHVNNKNDDSNVVDYCDDSHCASSVSRGAESYTFNRLLFEESCEETEDERQCIRANSPPVRLPESNEFISSNIHDSVRGNCNKTRTISKSTRKKKTKSAVKKESTVEITDSNYLFRVDNKVSDALSTKATKPHRPGLIKSLLTPQQKSMFTENAKSNNERGIFVDNNNGDNDNNTNSVTTKDIQLRNDKKTNTSTRRKRTLSNPASLRKTCTVSKVERALSTPSPYLCNNKSSVVNVNTNNEFILNECTNTMTAQQGKIVNGEVLNKLQKVYSTFHAYQEEKTLAKCIIQIHHTIFGRNHYQQKNNCNEADNFNNGVVTEGNNNDTCEENNASDDVTKELNLDMLAEFAWPIRHPRSRPITGLATIADSLLISVSRESTACIMSLPSGKLIRRIDADSNGMNSKNTNVQYTKHAAAYSGKRKAWSWVCANSVVPGQVYLGSVDGSMCVLDLLQPHMPIILCMHSTSSNLSTIYVPLSLTCTSQLFCTLPKRTQVITSHDRSKRKEAKSEVSNTKLISIVPANMSRNDSVNIRNEEAESKFEVMLRRHAELQQSLNRLCCSNATLKTKELRQLHHEGNKMKTSYALFSTYVHFVKWQHWLYEQRYRNYKSKILHEVETAQQIRYKYWCRWQKILYKHKFWRSQQVQWHLQKHLLQKPCSTSSSEKLPQSYNKSYAYSENKDMITLPLSLEESKIGTFETDGSTYDVARSDDSSVKRKKVYIMQWLIRMAHIMSCERHRLVAKQYFMQWQHYTRQQTRITAQMTSYNKLLLSLSGSMYSTSHLMLHALSTNALHSFRREQARTLSNKALELILHKSELSTSLQTKATQTNSKIDIWNTWQHALRWKYYRRWCKYVHDVRYTTYAGCTNTHSSSSIDYNNDMYEYNTCSLHQKNKNIKKFHNYKKFHRQLSESLVEPLSSLLIKTHEVRLRYFHQWMKYARYTAKLVRLQDEEQILHAERVAMQTVINSGVSKDVLASREVETSEAMAQTRHLQSSLLHREVELNSQIERLRQDTVLGQLLNAFSVENRFQCIRPKSNDHHNNDFNKSEHVRSEGSKEQTSTCNSEVNEFNALTLHNMCDTSQLSSEQPEQSDEAEEYNYSTAAMTVNSNGTINHNGKIHHNDNNDDEENESLLQDKTNTAHCKNLNKESGEVLLHKVGSLLRALKGKALQCDRDAKEIACAQAWALKLPIVDLPTSIINTTAITINKAPSSSLSFAHRSSVPSMESHSQIEMKNNNPTVHTSSYSSSSYSPLSPYANQAHGFATVLSVSSSNKTSQKQEDKPEQEQEEEEEERVSQEQYKSINNSSTSVTTSENSALFGAVRPSVRHRARVTSHASNIPTSPVGISTKQRVKLGVNEVHKEQSKTTNPLSGVNGNSTTRATPRAVNWNTASSTEPVYASLAIAFDTLVHKLYNRLNSLARELGVNVHHRYCNTKATIEILMEKNNIESNEFDNTESWLVKPEEQEEEQQIEFKTSIRETSSAVVSPLNLEIHDASTNKVKTVCQEQEPLKWIEHISIKDKKEIMTLLVKLMTLFDCFIAHSEMPLESTSSSLSLRGISSVQPLPLQYLCSRSSAQTLLSLACVLLELSHSRVWEEQNTICAIQSIITHSANAIVLESMLPRTTEFPGIIHKTHKPAFHKELRITRKNKKDYNNDEPAQLPYLCTDTGSNLSVSRITQQTWEAANSVCSSIDSHDKSKNCNSSALQSAASFTMNVNETPPTTVTPTITTHNDNDNKVHKEHSVEVKESMPHIPKLNISSLTHNLHHDEETNMALSQTKWDEYHDKSVGSTNTHDCDVNNISGSYSYASVEDRSVSTSHHFPSMSSTTPRSIGRTPRTFRVSAKAGPITRPYLGFRANINREVPTSTHTPSTTTSSLLDMHLANYNSNVCKEKADCMNVLLHDVHSVRPPAMMVTEVASSYINANGEQTTAPAAAAGLQAGDELIRFAGYAVTDLPAFNAIVSRHVRPNAALAVVLRRNGEEIRTTIHVGARKS